MVNVPAAYSPLIEEMSTATGLPQSVIAAQANAESGFNPTARSPTGALGWLQFEPSTYSTYAAQAGVSPVSEFNPADEAKVYDVFMSQLLKQEGGNVRNALAAYNAGPGNIPAGYDYADKILAAADQPITTTAATTGLGIPGLGGSLSISGILGNVFGDMRDMLERLGLILLGGALILLGIHLLSGGSSGGTTNVYQQAAGAAQPPKGKHAAGNVEKAAKTTGASEAIEAAAVA